MGDDAKTFATREFSQLTGIPVSTITKMLRKDQLRGEKRSGKWAIYQSELQHVGTAIEPRPRRPNAKTGGASETLPVHSDSYDIETFAEKTYLTIKGVLLWLKSGRLTGSMAPNGNATIDAANLSRPEIQYVLRQK